MSTSDVTDRVDSRAGRDVISDVTAGNEVDAMILEVLMASFDFTQMALVQLKQKKLSIPVIACGVSTSDVTGGVGPRAGGGVIDDVTAGAGRVGGDAEVGARISEVLVATVQRLSLGVVGWSVAFEEAALWIGIR